MKISFKSSNNVYEQIVDEIIKYIKLGIYFIVMTLIIILYAYLQN